jgi:spermidine/putrescine transport system substrate-binding protein
MTTLRWLGWEGYADGEFASALHAATGLTMAGESHLSDDVACRSVLASADRYDVININTPFVRDVLHPRGVICGLPDRLGEHIENLAEPFKPFGKAARSGDGALVGIPQRCGPFNLVINSKKVSPALVQAEGFSLALNPAFADRFGILSYEDFNVMHIAIAAGLNPFENLDETALSKFGIAAHDVYSSAKIITEDHNELNRSLVDGDIDFYISGGTYTASPARLDGRMEVSAVTPRAGPIDGKGAVAFVEINALVHHDSVALDAGIRFLKFISSDDGAVAASLAANACNPVVQMGASSVFNRFSRDHLAAMQWSEFEEDMSYCADYAIIPDFAKLVGIVRRARSWAEEPMRA